MPGLDPGIHQSSKRGWIAGSSPAMTKQNQRGLK
jgi:hypothetical protein